MDLETFMGATYCVVDEAFATVLDGLEEIEYACAIRTPSTVDNPIRSSLNSYTVR